MIYLRLSKADESWPGSPYEDKHLDGAKVAGLIQWSKRQWDPEKRTRVEVQTRAK